MATTKVLICNLALSELGLKAITALTELNERARKCNLIFDTTVDDVLRAHPWTFATKQAALAVASGETVIGYDYVYAFPTKCMFIRKLFTADTIDDPTPIPFKELNSTTNTRIIATNLENAYAEYTSQVNDVSVFDASFIKALAYKLAADMAVPLCGDSALATEKLKKYLLQLDDARRLNKAEAPESTATSGAYIDARA
jgi:hypothetical protein